MDSLRLAEEISKEAGKKQVTVSILLEVNAAGEESKFGITPGETLSLAQEIAKLPHIQIKGLMTIAPYTQNPEDNRIFFRNLRKLSVLFLIYGETDTIMVENGFLLEIDR